MVWGALRTKSGHRGSVEGKHKGRLDMYVLDRIKPGHSGDVGGHESTAEPRSSDAE